MISFPQFIEKDQQALHKIKKCIDILISLQTENGNFPSSVDRSKYGSRQRSDEDELIHWCHGAPGNCHCFYSYKNMYHNIYLTYN